ncbi:MAG TPA: hypothetical protein EYP17_06205, partial [Candidatus Latescibacteria bacterium]|nr:hypothetical protein [Candidatus Latescibacterota bacterium]
MRLATLRRDGCRLGVVREGKVLDVARADEVLGIGVPRDMMALIEGGKEALEKLMTLADEELWEPLSKVRLGPPVPRPNKFLALANERVDATVQVEADPEVETLNYQTGQIPARAVQAQVGGTARIPVTGTKDAPDEPARGMVFFINNINQPVTVPKGTVVATSAGMTIRFTTVEEVTVPGTVGAVAEAEVVAVDPGPSGNVGANLINMIEGPLSLQVKVTNPEP